jgi:hypothetical protein
MITDDPGTPGDGHWEINLAWTDQRTPGSTLIGLPLLDANYGVGDRLQLNYQASWNILRDEGEGTQSGMSDSQLAVKWRFYDAGETGLQLSAYPRVFFLDPGSDSDRRGTADVGDRGRAGPVRAEVGGRPVKVREDGLAARRRPLARERSHHSRSL